MPTVALETASVSYTGSGGTGPFTVPYYFLEESHLRVLREVIATGVQTLLALTTDYSVTGEGDAAGGTVTLVSAISSSYKLHILRDVPITQEAAYPRNDTFPAATHEEVVNKLTMIAQQLKEALDRAPQIPAGSALSGLVTFPAPGAGYYIRWNTDGDDLEAVPGIVEAGTYLASWTGAEERSVTAKLGEQPSGRDAGAAGDNVTVDTVNYQQLLDSGVKDITPLNVTGYKVGTLTVPSTIKSISGQRLYQNAANSNLLTATGLTRLRVSDSDFYGISGVAAASSNIGLLLDTCSNVQLSTLYFEGWQFYALQAKGVTDSVFTNLLGKGLADGFRFTSCNNITVNGALLHSPSTPANYFTVAFALDSTDGGNTVCENMTFNGVNVKDYVNAQAFLIHAGKKVSIIGGVLDNVSIGVGINAFNAADLIKDFTVQGLQINCTSTAGASGTGSVGISVYGYDVTSQAENIKIAGCTIRNANAVDQDVDRGGITAKWVQGLTAIGNDLEACYANGYAFYNRVNDLSLIGGTITDVAVYSGENNGMRFGGNGGGWMACNGEVRGVKIRNVGTAVRLDVTAAAACTIARSGATATVTKNAHGFAVGDWVRIAGVTFGTASDGYYLGAFQVASVPTANTFTYTMGGTPGTANAPGSPTVQGSYDGLYFNDLDMQGYTTAYTNSVMAVIDGKRTYLDGDKAPYVGRTSQMTITNASAVAITSFRGGVVGQRVLLCFTDTNTTITHGTPIKTVGGGDIASAARMSVWMTCVDATVGANVWEFQTETTAS